MIANRSACDQMVTVQRPPSVGGGGATYTERGTPAAAAPGLIVSDPDGRTITGEAVGVSSGFLPGDQLGFSAQSGLTGAYDPASGLLAISGPASAATYQDALRTAGP